MKAVGHVLVEAVLASALVGAFEATRVASASNGFGAWPILAAVATIGALGVVLVTRVVVAGLARIPALAAWSHELAGGERVVSAWRALLMLLAVIAVAIASFRISAWAHTTYRFIDGGPVGLLIAGTTTPLAVGTCLIAMLVDRQVAPRLRDSQLLAGRRSWIAAALAITTTLVLPPLLVGAAAPAISLAPVTTVCVAIVAVVVLRALKLGRYRNSQLVAVVAALAVGTGTWAMSGAPRARGAIVVHGVTSQVVARMLWSLADRDHDGYPGSAVGGADCDDADATRSPGLQELPDNGIDENCSGADVAVESLGVRTRAREAEPIPARPNIVVISIDALRADHLGSYGYARNTSPKLDAFAATGTRFAWAFTSCPSTRCAIPSLLTGRYASTLGEGAESDAVPSAAELFRDAGYTTAAITCCERFTLAKRELAGFTVIDASADATRMQRAGQSNADVVADNTLEWLRAHDPQQPYFLWLHFYDPHHPYEAPSGPDFGERDVDRYDTEISYVDQHVGRVLAALDPSTIVVVTADHGDEFNEHGIRFHARSLFNQVVRVPLIVRAPSATARAVDTPVSIVDVLPTMLDLAGIAGPRGMNGVSLAPALRGAPAPVRPVFIELIPDHQIHRDMAAVISSPWKAIWDRRANAWSLYSLGDPDDSDDRVDDPELPRMQKLLRETLDRETSRLP